MSEPSTIGHHRYIWCVQRYADTDKMGLDLNSMTNEGWQIYKILVDPKVGSSAWYVVVYRRHK